MSNRFEVTSQNAQTFTMAKISKHGDKKMNSHFALDPNTNEGECSVFMVLYQKNYQLIDPIKVICLCKTAHTKYLIKR